MNNILSQTEISFLYTINTNIQVNKEEKYKYICIQNWGEDQIAFFIEQLRDGRDYLIFPFITAAKRPDLPYLRLSDQFLVNNQSSPKLISRFIDNQFDLSNFQISPDSTGHLYFKFKEVTLGYK